MRSLKEIQAEKDALAKDVFHPQQLAAWRAKGVEDAANGLFKVPSSLWNFTDLADHIYTMAWSGKRYKLARAKRDGDGESNG